MAPSETTDDSSSSAAITIPTFSPNSTITIPRLEEDNFHIWRSQVIPYLKGQGVFGFVDGSIEAPPKTITTGSTVTTNPQFKLWEKSDSLLLTIINSSLDKNILARVYEAETCAQLWTKLHTLYASRSKARVANLRLALSTTRKKKDTSAVEYFTKMKNLADEMRLAGYPLTDDEFLTYLLPGLGENYESLIQMAGNTEGISLDHVFAQMLSTETRIKMNELAATGGNLSSPPTASAQANYARGSSSTQQGGSHYRPNNTGNSHGPQQSHQGNYRNTSGQFNGNYRGRGGRNGGRGKGRNSDPNAICQICAKQGHTAKECYFRYKESSDPAAIPPPSRPSPPPHAYSMHYGQYPPPPYPYPYPSYYPPPPPNDWVADTGATHHLTPDPRNLTHSEPYDGPDRVHVGDGSGSFGTHSS